MVIGHSALALALCLMAAAACGAAGCSKPAPEPPGVRISGTTWRVELALDDQKRMRGMGGRREVPAGTGMLFVFAQERPLNFHMLDCFVPLDVAFISADLKVVEVRTMVVEDDPAVPACLYPSRFPAQYALEVAAGDLGRAGVKPGDTVELLGAARNAAKDAR